MPCDAFYGMLKQGDVLENGMIDFLKDIARPFIGIHLVCVIYKAVAQWQHTRHIPTQGKTGQNI